MHVRHAPAASGTSVQAATTATATPTDIGTVASPSNKADGASESRCGADEPFAERAECPDLQHQRHGDELPAEQDPDRGSARAESRRNPKREHESEAGTSQASQAAPSTSRPAPGTSGDPAKTVEAAARDREAGPDGREDQSEARGHAGREEGEPRTPRNDQLPKDAGAEIARPERRSRQDRGDDAELGEHVHATREVLEPAGGSVLGGLRRVQDQEDGVGDDHGHDRERERRRERVLAACAASGTRRPRASVAAGHE